MKKIIFALIALFTLSVQAQTYGVGLGYERDFATTNRGGLEHVSKASVLTGMKTKAGTFDAGLYEVHVEGASFQDNQQGVEVGYGNGLPVGRFILSGRVAAGKVFNRGLGSPSSIGYYNTYAVNVARPITQRLSTSIGVRYRPAHDFDEQKQYSLGLSYRLSKQVMLQGTFRHTRSNGPTLNGINTTVLYYF